MSNHPIAVFIIFGVIAFLNWLVRKGGAKDILDGGFPPGTTRRDTPPVRQATSSAQSEEERLRKFMEALGVPANTPPPRRIAQPQQKPQYIPAARKQIPKRALPKVSTPSPAPTPVPMPVMAAPSYETETVAAPSEDSETFMRPAAAAKETAVAVASPPVALKNLSSLLKSPSNLRAALVMKEILGAPRALQPFEGARGFL